MDDSKTRVIELCRRRAEEGMPSAMVEALVSLLRPSIRLIPVRGRVTAVGGSRIGGLPDLPEGMDWPLCEKVADPLPDWAPASWNVLLGQPFSFLMQIDLAEIAPFDLEKQLPDSGMLYFFYLDYYRFKLSPSPDDLVVVRFAPPNSGPLRRVSAPPQLPKTEVYRAYSLSPQVEWTISEPYDLQRGGASTEEIEASLEHFGDCWDRKGLRTEVAAIQGFDPDHDTQNRMLGHPELIQSYLPAHGSLSARLLLQIDSDRSRKRKTFPSTGMMWGDAGRIYYYIEEDDLRACRFDKTWAILETH